MMRHQVDTISSFSRFAGEETRTREKPFVHLCRQYGSLPEYRNVEALLRKKLESHSRKDELKQKNHEFTRQKS